MELEMQQFEDVTTEGGNIRASRVSGTEVYNADGEHIGQIDDVVLDKRSGKADYAIMSFGGFLGIGERYHPLPWQSLAYDPARGGYVVSVDRDRLECAPTYARNEEPDWNDRAFNDRILGHYGYPLV
jgi:sporulation protein YlmC with PRC-barrel domain